MKKSRICWIRILFPVLSVLLFSIFLLTIKVNAAGVSSDPLPFYKAYIDTYQPFFTQHPDTLNTIVSSYNLNSSNNYVILIYPYNDTNSEIWFSTMLLGDTEVGRLTPKNSSGSDIDISNFVSFRSDYFIYNYRISCKKWYITKSNNSIYSGGSNIQLTGNQLLGNSSPNSFGLTYYYPIFIQGSMSYGDSYVFTDIAPQTPLPEIGSVPDPSLDLPTFDPTEAPTVPSYTLPSTSNRPVFDINSPIQSVFDIVQWSFNYVFDLIKGVIQNIIDWATFFYNLIIWLFQNWWGFLSYLIEWLYKAFKFLFEPIYNFLNALFVDNNGAVSIAELLLDFINRFDIFTSSIFQDTFFTNFWNNFTDNFVDGLLYFRNVVLFFNSLVSLGMVNNEFSITAFYTSLFVPSSQQVIQAVLDHDDFDFIGTSKIVIADAPRILSQLYNVTATPVFHIPSCTFHGVEIGNFDISFAWFAPYKIYYDVIVSTFLVIAYIYWIFVTLHSHIRTTYTPGPQEDEYWRY